jgi:hypothetical protein
MPVCNKCKKHSNCLTIDPCDHCGAKDWDERTVLSFSGKPRGESSTKTYGQKLGDELFGSPLKDYARIPPPKVSLSSEFSGLLGWLSGLVVVVVIGYCVYYFFFMSDRDYLSSKYNVPIERVDAASKPHGCAFNDAPLGDKHCHFEKHVYVFDKNNQVIEIDGKARTCPTGCGSADRVQQDFQRVDE